MMIISAAVLSAELLRLWWPMKSVTGLLLLIADIWSKTIVRAFTNLCLFSTFNSRDTHSGQLPDCLHFVRVGTAENNTGNEPGTRNYQ